MHERRKHTTTNNSLGAALGDLGLCLGPQGGELALGLVVLEGLGLSLDLELLDGLVVLPPNLDKGSKAVGKWRMSHNARKSAQRSISPLKHVIVVYQKGRQWARTTTD